MSQETTEDGFLGGRLSIAQPKKGFRAGHDSVLLAAAVPAHDDERVAEWGAGVGVASLCLAARVGGVLIEGVEIDPNLAGIAQANAARNLMADRVHFAQGDALAFAGGPFDHIFFNPPFHPNTGRGSPDAARERAMRAEEGLIASWIARALTSIAAEGSITLILRADGVADLLPALSGHRVASRLLLPRQGEAAKRAILHIRPGSSGITQLTPLILHRQDGKPTEQAESILRRGEALAYP